MGSTNFPTSLDSYSYIYDNVTAITAGRINDIQEAVEAIEAKVGAGSYSETLSTLVYNFLYSDNILWFYMNAAPTGWTIHYTYPYDDLVAVKGGSGSYNWGAGGAHGALWSTLKAHTHGFSHEHNVPDHQHRWYNSIDGAGSHDQVFNSGGALNNIAGGPQKDYGYYCLSILNLGDVPTGYPLSAIPTDPYTDYDGVGTTTGCSSTTTGAMNNTNIQPPAAVGIAAKKD